MLEFGILVGKILATITAMLDLQQLIKQTCNNAKANLAAAERNYDRFGMFEDCGPSYESDLRIAEAKMNQHQILVPKLIQMQKQIKHLKHQCKEQFPDETNQYLVKFLDAQTKGREDKVAKQNRAKKTAIKQKQRELAKQQALTAKQKSEL